VRTDTYEIILKVFCWYEYLIQQWQYPKYVVLPAGKKQRQITMEIKVKRYEISDY